MLELIYKFNKVVGYKINIQKSMVFLYTHNELSEKERTHMGSAIPLMGVYLNNKKTLIKKDSYSPVFIAALFIITKVSKQPKYLLMDK